VKPITIKRESAVKTNKKDNGPKPSIEKKKEASQKAPAKRGGRKPSAAEKPSATTSRPKRQSVKKVNYNEDIPKATEKMPSYRDFMAKKREERSMATQSVETQNEEEEFVTQKSQNKPTKRVAMKVPIKQESSPKRNRADALDGDEYDFPPREPLKDVKTNVKKSPKVASKGTAKNNVNVKSASRKSRLDTFDMDIDEDISALSKQATKTAIRSPSKAASDSSDDFDDFRAGGTLKPEKTIVKKVQQVASNATDQNNATSKRASSNKRSEAYKVMEME